MPGHLNFWIILKGTMCACKKICNFLKKTPSFILHNLHWIASLLFIIGILLFLVWIFGIWEKDGLESASGSIFIAATLLFGLYSYQNDIAIRNSEFYMKIIIKYFKNSVKLIQDSGNNNIQWHAAIRYLQTVEDLLPRLSERSHREIYITDYVNTAYSISHIIDSIDSFKFFYGIANYNNKTEMDLYEESTPAKLGSCSRIDPAFLLFLAAFIEKAGRIEYSNRGKGDSLIDSMDTEYFKKPTKDYRTDDLFSCVIIKDYIRSYEGCRDLKPHA